MDASAVATGLKELDAAIDRLPNEVTEDLKSTAKVSADRIAARAKAILRSKTHRTGRTADAIRVLDESDRKQWVVNSPGHPDDPANLSMWLEYGTKFMSARAFMRPAGDAESETYRTTMTATAERTAERVLGS